MTTQEWIAFDEALAKACGWRVESVEEHIDFNTRVSPSLAGPMMEPGIVHGHATLTLFRGLTLEQLDPGPPPLPKITLDLANHLPGYVVTSRDYALPVAWGVRSVRGGG